jgi:putative acetyltransferase
MLKITPADPRSPEAGQLISALSAEMAVLYGGDGSGLFHVEDVLVPGGAFVIAWHTGRPVGCGALRPFGETGIGEIKRMYVAREMRGQRLGQAILEKLEELARGFGYYILRLETGTLQPDAMRLYARCGYVRCGCYGPYTDDPLSVC